MKISKLGNNHSDILSSIMNVQPTKTEQSSFQKIAQSILSQPEKPTLKQVFAQFEEMGDSVVDADPVGNTMGAEPVDGPMDDGSTDTVTEEIKQKLADALIAACGGVEEAKQCLDSLGLGSEEPLPDEMGGMDEMGTDSMGTDGMGMDVPSPANDMASPMEMPAPMSY